MNSLVNIFAFQCVEMIIAFTIPIHLPGKSHDQLPKVCTNTDNNCYMWLTLVTFVTDGFLENN